MINPNRKEHLPESSIAPVMPYLSDEQITFLLLPKITYQVSQSFRSAGYSGSQTVNACKIGSLPTDQLAIEGDFIALKNPSAILTSMLHFFTSVCTDIRGSHVLPPSAQNFPSARPVLRVSDSQRIQARFRMKEEAPYPRNEFPHAPAHRRN